MRIIVSLVSLLMILERCCFVGEDAEDSLRKSLLQACQDVAALVTVPVPDAGTHEFQPTAREHHLLYDTVISEAHR